MVSSRYHFNDVPVHNSLSRLCQGFNLLRNRVPATTSPIFPQFLSMYHRPFPDEDQSAARQFTLHDFQRLDCDRCLKLAVSCVKMRRRMIVEEHPDQDAVKCADGGHETKPIHTRLDYSP